MRAHIKNAARTALALVAVAGLLAAAPGEARAAGDEIYIDKQPWSFAGIFGHYDAVQLQRGFKVYNTVCAGCHGMSLLSYRNLTDEHGPHMSPEAVAAIAAERSVTVLDEDGEPSERPAILSDRFVSPYPNEQAARAANGGAYPPDLSVIAKARSASQESVFAPLTYLTDIVTGYQEGGPDYLYALLVGYVDAPSDVEMGEGMSYNKAFPGHQIAMAAPLSDGSVDYTDGTPNSLDQQARDVSAFLMWAAEPHLEERKQLGIRVMIYLLILTVLLYLAKRAVWSRVEH
ncbi:MAG: cytochrome c1 [Rhizobiales bacterium]|nr:cytochrome c1 [Hyphomicrobiales bacterium]